MERGNLVARAGMQVARQESSQIPARGSKTAHNSTPNLAIICRCLLVLRENHTNRDGQARKFGGNGLSTTWRVVQSLPLHRLRLPRRLLLLRSQTLLLLPLRLLLHLPNRHLLQVRQRRDSGGARLRPKVVAESSENCQVSAGVLESRLDASSRQATGSKIVRNSRLPIPRQRCLPASQDRRKNQAISARPTSGASGSSTIRRAAPNRLLQARRSQHRAVLQAVRHRLHARAFRRRQARTARTTRSSWRR